MYFPKQGYALSYPMAEEMRYDSEAMRRFAGIALGDDRIADETTILNFRYLPEKHQLTEQLFAKVNRSISRLPRRDPSRDRLGLASCRRPWRSGSTC